ncbi:MAG: M20 family metallopeptidase [Bacillati bacterium ANGP1]|uniref:Probable succinyl-diaminopimelate desuccinylase n=1 Tax=Candidatus Segetimicrobium genomatis TaxID=2569760 RepID=A0A537INU8_9BACT|nr:MAG: M20 family metallopeptidase [Terrabacteria group bacterium ANGP1]
METVGSHIERQRAALVGLLANLVRTPSPNPPGDTRAVADLITARLRESAVDFQVLADEPRKPNIIARIGHGRPELLFTSHMDTAPAGNRRAWRHDPFAAEIVGARMYGRGAADAKASLVAMLAAIGALVEVLPLHGTLVFTAVSDEEVGGINGTEYLVDRGLVHPDHVVVGEITHNRLAVAEKGIVWMRIITHGRAAHSSTPWEGANAISSMLRVLQAVEDRIGARLRLLSHPLVPPPSINIGTIRGGVATNIVPDWCEATIDRRTLPNENVQEAVAEIDRVVADLRAQDPQLQADVEVIQCGPPIETPLDAPLVRAAQDVARALELQPEPVGYQQASDGRFFAERGVPTILFGPGDPEVAHAADESVDLDQLITAAKFYAMLGQKTLSQE